MSVSPHPSLATVAEYHDVAELAFTPVPVRARHDGWTPERQRAFITILSRHGCVAEAARAAGKSTAPAAYKLRERADAESFANAWDKAIKWGTQISLDTALERALHGEVRPNHYKGEKKADIERHDNRILIAVLNSQWRRKSVRTQPRKAAGAPTDK